MGADEMIVGMLNFVEPVGETRKGQSPNALEFDQSVEVPIHGGQGDSRDGTACGLVKLIGGGVMT